MNETVKKFNQDDFVGAVWLNDRGGMLKLTIDGKEHKFGILTNNFKTEDRHPTYRVRKWIENGNGAPKTASPAPKKPMPQQTNKTPSKPVQKPAYKAANEPIEEDESIL